MLVSLNNLSLPPWSIFTFALCILIHSHLIVQAKLLNTPPLNHWPSKRPLLCISQWQNSLPASTTSSKGDNFLVRLPTNSSRQHCENSGESCWIWCFCSLAASTDILSLIDFVTSLVVHYPLLFGLSRPPTGYTASPSPRCSESLGGPNWCNLVLCTWAKRHARKEHSKKWTTVLRPKRGAVIGTDWLSPTCE